MTTDELLPDGPSPRKLIAWSSLYSVKNEKLDYQHRRMVRLINELYKAVEEGKEAEILGEVLGDVVNYTQRHFTDEEALMKAHNYPEYENHKAIHDKLTKQVLDVQKQYQASKGDLSMSVLMFLSDWWLKHILREDKKYAPFLGGA